MDQMVDRMTTNLNTHAVKQDTEKLIHPATKKRAK